jgi:protein SCO1/2
VKVAFLALAFLLAACTSSGPSFKNTDVTGVDYAKGFQLTDHTGQPRSLADFRGKAVVVFFGYTHCPDVCPATLLEIKQALDQIGEEKSRVQVLFITVDPERDTPALLAKYVPAFDPTFIGLSGSPEQTARVTKDFHVFAQKAPGRTPDSYTVDHTAGMYVFDPKGQLRLFARPGRPGDLAADLHTLLASAG